MPDHPSHAVGGGRERRGGVHDGPHPRSGATWSLPLTFGALLVGGAVVLAVRSPHVRGSYGFCPSALLGMACPGCGGLRATHDLVHGDVASAWAHNPLVVLALPALLALVVRWGWDAAHRQPPWSPPTWLGVSAAVVLLAFWVARNVPALAPHLGPLAVP